jgi:hypothetical protein
LAEEAGVDVNMIGTNSRRASEASILDVLAGDLLDPHWHVEAEPVFGPVKPDFLVEDDAGNAYIIEVKMAAGGAHFGSVAQTAAFREAAATKRRGNVGAILVLAGGDARELESAGKDYGVEVVGTNSIEPDKVAQALVDHLRVAFHVPASI